MPELQLLHQAHAQLGEGPVWSAEERAVYWVDIEGCRLLRHDTVSLLNQEFAMPSEIGCIAERSGGGLIAGLRSGLFFIDTKSGDLQLAIELEADQPNNRINDGKCDPCGRFLVGSMDVEQKKASGSLYSIGPDLIPHRLDQDYLITNGPAFSPDGKTLYHNDSAKRLIYAYDYDLDEGAVSRRRVLAEIPEGEGYPDGITVDAEGHLWCAIWGGWRIDRFDTSGRVIQSIPLPVMCPTSLTFGGDDLMTMFITSATTALSAEQRTEQPLAGALLSLAAGVQGLPTANFEG